MKVDLKHGSLICKIIELIFCIMSSALAIGPFGHLPIDTDHVGLFHAAITGYILINAMLIGGYLLSERLSKKLGLIFTIMGTILCLAAGIVLIRDWSQFDKRWIKTDEFTDYNNKLAAAGFFALFAALVFSTEIFFIVKYSDD